MGSSQIHDSVWQELQEDLLVGTQALGLVKTPDMLRMIVEEDCTHLQCTAVVVYNRHILKLHNSFRTLYRVPCNR
jgi:tRNA splicing ligase